MSDYSSTYPTQSPTFAFDAKAGKLDSRLSYTRSSTGTYLSNEKALSSENLVPYSNLSSGFSFGRTTLASTNNSAPDGGSDAALILETADPTSSHEVYKSFSCVSGQQYSFVFYLKANGRTKAMIRPQMTSVIADVEFDLTAVTSTVISGSADSHSITAIGSTGWCKCAVTVTATATGTGYTQFNLLDAGGNITYTGDVTKGMFAWGAVASTCGTVLNATSGSIHREYAPLLKTASADAPRLEYATDGQSDGLLIEQQFTQLVQWSEEFDNTAGWSGAGISIQPNAGVAPDGTLSADLLVEADEVSGNNSHYARQSMSVAGLAAGQTYTLSVYAKAAGRNHAALYTSIGGANAVGIFSLVDGSNTYNNGNGTWSSTDCGNGWFRLQLTFTTVNANNHFVLFYTAQDATTYAYTGNGYGSVLLWGANLTQTASSMSYLKAEGSQTTKSADSCSVADFGYTGGDASVYVESTSSGGDFPGLIGLDDGGSTNCMRVFRNSGSATNTTDFQYNINDSSGINQVASLVSGSGAGTKFAMRLANNNAAFAFDGNTPTTDTNCVMPVATTLDIGSGAGVSQINGTIKRVALYNVALSDTELQSLTS